jgi:hypothetical protein
MIVVNVIVAKCEVQIPIAGWTVCFAASKTSITQAVPTPVTNNLAFRLLSIRDFRPADSRWHTRYPAMVAAKPNYDL